MNRCENRSLVKYRLIVDEFGGCERFQQLLTALQQVAERHAVGLGAIAIRWVLDRPAVSGVIVGARHERHVDQIAQACRIALDARDRAEIAEAQAAASGPSGDVYTLERVKGGRHASVMRYTLNQH